MTNLATYYYEDVQFVTSDGLDFVTADDDFFHVNGGGYFDDTENRQEKLNTITFGSYSFTGSKIKSLKLHHESGLLTDQLAIDTLTVEIESDTRPVVVRYTPITVRRGDVAMGVFFNGRIKEIGKRRYSLYAESYISLLDYDYHYGGMYTAAIAGDVIANIMGEIPYTIHPDVAALKLYGYLPYASKRENLLQVLIATGAAIAKNTDGTMHIAVLTGTDKGTFADNRVFMDGTLDEDTQVTAVQVTEHAYAPITDEITLFTESFTDVRTAKFTEPAHSLTITGGTILEGGVNYAKIQGAGAVTLTGKKYRHTTKIVTRGNVLGTPDDKIVTVTNATLITAINSSSAAQRLYAYAKCNRTVKQNVMINQERAGDIVQVTHPYKVDYLSAAIHSLDLNMSNTLRASGEFLVDYVPQGISEGYKNRVLLTGSGNWTVPAGVTEIRTVLIGGGQGGSAGEDGDEGSQGSRKSSVNDLSRGNGGKGGKAGTPGLGGKVVDLVVPVAPGQSFAYASGAGGTGGATDGAEGALGGATTFKSNSSELGAVGEYIDAMTAERYAFAGTGGMTGANGSGGQTEVGGIRGPDGVLYPNGWSGLKVIYKLNNGTYNEYIGAQGGAGGGAAVGSGGADGADGTADWNNGHGAAQGGRGGNGAPGNDGSPAAVFGSGGDGGHGGGGGGGGGDAYHPETRYHGPGSGGSGGRGGRGGNGAPGCIIVYY